MKPAPTRSRNRKLKRGALAGCTLRLPETLPFKLTRPFAAHKAGTLYVRCQAAGALFAVLFVFRNKTGSHRIRPDGRSSAGFLSGDTQPRVPGAYNLCMARGWESKSVEAQQAEAQTKAAQTGRPPTAADAALLREIENLRLARERVLQQIAASPNPRRRMQLEKALVDLDEKLSSR